jgi:probable F420-dependent oxidoreductase
MTVESTAPAARRPIRFGLLNETPAPPQGLLAHARRAESRGFSTFLIRDHFIAADFGPQLAPMATLGAVAAATSRLRVGTLVFDNDYRHPALLAKEAATIDVLSGGRFELGLGAGWLRAEYEATGLPFDPVGVRISRLEEAITVMKGLFAERPVTFEGKHYRIEGLEGYPTPVQRPHPPILIGAGKPRMLRLAGREADIVGVLPTTVSSGVEVDDPRDRLPEKVDAQLDAIREGAGPRFDDIELSVFATLVVTDHRRETTEQLIAERAWSGITPEQVWSMPSPLIGTVEQIVEAIEVRRTRFGFTYYVVSDRQLEEAAAVLERLA